MKPRIQMLHTSYPHWGEFTGVGPFVRQLRQHGCRVAVRTVSDSDDDFPIRNKRLRDGLRSRLHGQMAWYKLSDLIGELHAGARCLLRTCDIVHYVDGEHSAHYLPIALKRSGALAGGTVATFHQPPDALVYLVDRRVAACLDRIVIVSPIQRAFFEEHVQADRVREILWGVDSDYFRPAEIKSTSGPFRCVTVGHWLRDWPAMRALARLLIERRADIALHVVTNRATGLEGLRNVHSHHNLTDPELLALYQQSDVLLLPLTASTANNTLLEALACGLPVISTRLPSVQAYVPASAALLVAENDPDLLFQALDALRADQERRATMAQLARARGEELSWARIAATYATLYLELLK
jgi:glycosyltransferase involved in cell wall biosynthesis